jgi:hypothetical protein
MHTELVLRESCGCKPASPHILNVTS